MQYSVQCMSTIKLRDTMSTCGSLTGTIEFYLSLRILFRIHVVSRLNCVRHSLWCKCLLYILTQLFIVRVYHYAFGSGSDCFLFASASASASTENNRFHRFRFRFRFRFHSPAYKAFCPNASRKRIVNVTSNFALIKETYTCTVGL